jgi:hypothetical protein
MEEAKYSFNIRFNLSGYDCQFTLRSDENGLTILQSASKVISELEKLGAVGERRWEQVKNGNGKEAQAQPQPKSGHHDNTGGKGAGAAAKPGGLPSPKDKGKTEAIRKDGSVTCPLCGVVGEVELIGFTRGGFYKQAWKCQACEKWLQDEDVRPADPQEDLPF